MTPNNAAWTLVATAPANIVLQNLGESDILITLSASLPAADKIFNAEEPTDQIECLKLLPRTEPQRLSGLDTLSVNVYARTFGSRSNSNQLGFFVDV